MKTILFIIVCCTRRDSDGKSPFKLNARYWCMHNTRNEATSNMEAVQRKNPSKQRSKNTGCPFFLKIQVSKNVSFNSNSCRLKIVQFKYTNFYLNINFRVEGVKIPYHFSRN